MDHVRDTPCLLMSSQGSVTTSVTTSVTPVDIRESFLRGVSHPGRCENHEGDKLAFLDAKQCRRSFSEGKKIIFQRHLRSFLSGVELLLVH